MSEIRKNPIAWRNSELIRHGDGLARCPWPGQDPIYVAYHDEEWGAPERDARALYEKLVLDGFQAGLSWITILRKREAFREAFSGFRPDLIVDFDEKRVMRLMENAGIIRNRAKIEGAVASAKAWLAIEEKQGFSSYLWDFVDGRPIVNRPRRMGDVPAQTELSEKLSKDLKSRGFKFCGPTIVYAFMQAVGMVNDHLVGCHCAQESGGSNRTVRRRRPSAGGSM
jgi:DNA-3-methyladenine glycosylase I